MVYENRKYQQDAINCGIDFFQDKKKKFNAIEILPTGSGKSLIIAKIVTALKGKCIVFQPSKEILEQNFSKFLFHGGRGGIYSASAGMKYVDHVTYATIGSVVNKTHLFKDVEHIIIDECHLVNSEAGMYFDFIKALPGAKILGLTATPYRLESTRNWGSMLKFINRTNPRIFNKIIYYVQNDTLFNAGHLAKLEYYNINVIDRNKLEVNALGSDFTEASIRKYYREIDMPHRIIDYGKRLLTERKNLLIFCSMISEAETVKKGIPGSAIVTSDTHPDLRAKILKQFKAGIIKCVINVGVLIVGFDYPELEAVLIARSTMSLAVYYQMIGRAMRPHKDKICAWVVDLGGNYNFFGKIETMQIVEDRGLFSVWNTTRTGYRQLTNVKFQKYANAA